MKARGCLTGLLVFVLIVIVAGAVWWAMFIRSPEHSMMRLTLAANTGDWAEVQTYADIDAISNDIAGKIVNDQVGGLGIELGALGDTLAAAAVPAVAEQIEQQARAQVVRRQGRRNTFRDVIATFYYVNRADVVVDGDVAQVQANLPFLGKRRATQFRMEKAGPVWRVVEIANINQLVETDVQ